MRIGEARIEAIHVDHDVGADREVGERLDRDLIPAFGQHAHACQLLAAVDPHAAGTARGMQAGVAQRERGIEMQLNPVQRIERGHALVHRDLELVEAPITVAARVAGDA